MFTYSIEFHSLIFGVSTFLYKNLVIMVQSYVYMYKDSEFLPSDPDEPVPAKKKRKKKPVPMKAEPKKRGRKKKALNNGSDPLRKFSCDQCNVAFQVKLHFLLLLLVNNPGIRIQNYFFWTRIRLSLQKNPDPTFIQNKGKNTFII